MEAPGVGDMRGRLTESLEESSDTVGRHHSTGTATVEEKN